MRRFSRFQKWRQKTLFFWLVVTSVVLALFLQPAQNALNARPVSTLPTQNGALTTLGSWQARNVDLVYSVAFSSAAQPNGPLVVYRAPGADLRALVPVAAVQRGPGVQTPLLFPSPDGRYLALLSPVKNGYAANLNGATLSIVATDGTVLPSSPGALSAPVAATFPRNGRVLAPSVALSDQVIWSADSQALYYHSGVLRAEALTSSGTQARQQTALTGYDEIHRVDLAGHDLLLYRQPLGDTSLRLVGLDRTGALILTLAHPEQPVIIATLPVGADVSGTPPIDRPSSGILPFHRPQSSLNTHNQALTVVMTLPSDILPGNVLRVGSDGMSIECERVLSWHPFNEVIERIAFSGRAISRVPPLFDTSRYGRGLTARARSSDGALLVMSQVLRTRGDLAARGVPGVPAQETLLLADTRSGAQQTLILPYGAQLVQVFWTARSVSSQMHALPSNVLPGLLAFHKRLGGPSQNASVLQQDEWMLEGHANRLADAPALPRMCYGLCASPNGPPHVSAAILHGVAYTESNWHQFNTSDYRINGEPVGSPVESWDGGWGEYQQTWGMPPQCKNSNNCRSDAFRVQHDQSYNIGVGIQSLINAWNGTAGVSSNSDPNDPYKANQWFFAVWAYNGSYGNNPNDIPSSQYGHWYPGAPFRSIYEEYVWYFAANPQYASNGWTDNYLPSLGPTLLPPQSDFVNTSDSFVACVTCSIPDWTAGTYDREWVGMGAPSGAIAGYFTSTFTQLGGEDVLGLPRDNGGGAALHRWGNGWVQDFGGGSGAPGALMLADGTITPYWVHGGIWTQYLTNDRGVNGCHAYPTSNLAPYVNSGLGSDSYLRQTFQRGFIVWDVTTGMVVSDVC